MKTPGGWAARGPVAAAAAWLLAGPLVVPGSAPAGASAYQRPGTTQRISVTSSGKVGANRPCEFGDESGCPTPWRGYGSSLSADGRYVAFETTEDGLVAGDRNGVSDVFIRNLRTGTTRQVDLASDGTPAAATGTTLLANSQLQDGGRTNVLSFDPSISANGRYVAFASSADNLVPGRAGDTNLAADVFVHDLKTGKTTRVSVDSAGHQSMFTPAANGVPELPGSFLPSISANGRYVSFTSFASNLVPGDTNNAPDVFVHDLRTRRTVRVDVSGTGAQATGGWNAGTDLDLTSLLGDATSLDIALPQSSISGTGRYVAFSSPASNLVPGDTNSANDVFVHDIRTGRTTRVSVASDGAQGLDPDPTYGNDGYGGGSQLADWDQPVGRAISDNGRFVAFVSRDDNLVPADGNAVPGNSFSGIDVFVHDAWTRRTTRVSVTSYGEEAAAQVTAYTYSPSLSPDGRYVTFTGYRVGLTDTPRSGPQTGPEGGIYVYDRVSGSIERADVPVYGEWGGSLSDIGNDGRYVSFSSFYQKLVAGNPCRDCWDVYVRDRGAAVGAGRLVGRAAGSGGRSVVGSTAITDVSLTARPDSHDLLLRERLNARVARPFASAADAPGVVYGLDFSVTGRRYELRAQNGPGPGYDPEGGGSFALFLRAPDGGWQWVSTLRGGFLTAGEEIDVGVPVSLLGVDSTRRVTHVRAFRALGSLMSGTLRKVQRIIVT